jgi:hypothetical protein
MPKKSAKAKPQKPHKPVIAIPAADIMEEAGKLAQAAGLMIAPLHKGHGLSIVDPSGTYLIAELRRVSGKGMRLFMVSPRIRTAEDMEITFQDLQGMALAHATVEGAWAGYQKSKTTANWQQYTGALAAFYTRAFASIPPP